MPSRENLMKMLLVSMAAMAETSGPVSRCVNLAKTMKSFGIEVATCIAEDVNFRNIENVPNYFLEIPSPLGLPSFYAKHVFPIIQKLNIAAHKTVKSFDEVLFFTGNLDYRYLKKSTESIRSAIREFNPDIIYSEFNISAFIAAKLENKKLYATVSFPTQHAFANKPELAKDLNRLLKEYGIKPVDSALQLFDWADRKFCPSIKELEPMDNVIFCGSFSKACKTQIQKDKNKILVYMGNGTISARKMKAEISKAFSDSKYEVYIASSYLKECSIKNIHIAQRWNFSELLNEAALFINHGGQNSIVQSLQYGVPELIVPGKVFERRYNAESVLKNGAALVLSHSKFNAENIRSLAEKIINSTVMSRNAFELGMKLSVQGGADRIIKEMLY